MNFERYSRKVLRDAADVRPEDCPIRDVAVIDRKTNIYYACQRIPGGWQCGKCGVWDSIIPMPIKEGDQCPLCKTSVTIWRIDAELIRRERVERAQRMLHDMINPPPPPAVRHCSCCRCRCRCDCCP